MAVLAPASPSLHPSARVAHIRVSPPRQRAPGPTQRFSSAQAPHISRVTQPCASVRVHLQERHENTYLSARNIPYLNLRSLDNLNARDILKAKKVGFAV